MRIYHLLPDFPAFSGAWDSLQKQVPGLFVSWHTPQGLRGCWKPSHTEGWSTHTKARWWHGWKLWRYGYAAANRASQPGTEDWLEDLLVVCGFFFGTCDYVYYIRYVSKYIHNIDCRYILLACLAHAAFPASSTIGVGSILQSFVKGFSVGGFCRWSLRLCPHQRPLWFALLTNYVEGLGNDNISHFGSQDPGIVADILPQGKKSQLMEFRFFLQGERADMSSAPDLLIRIFAKSPKCFQCTLPSSVWIDVRSILHSFEPCSVPSLAALAIHELILANLLRIHWTGN